MFFVKNTSMSFMRAKKLHNTSRMNFINSIFLKTYKSITIASPKSNKTIFLYSLLSIFYNYKQPS